MTQFIVTSCYRHGETLSFKEHIHAKINKAYMMLGLIKRHIKYLAIPNFYSAIHQHG